MEDLEHIKDLKEAKDTWQDAGDELYDSLEQMAQSSLFSQIVNDGLALNAGQEWKDVILYTNNPSMSFFLAGDYT